MSSTFAPEQWTIRRLVFLLLALALAANLAVPTANATSTTCAPGAGGVGTALGLSHGFVEAWNCASITYHDSGAGKDVTVAALGTGLTTTA